MRCRNFVISTRGEASVISSQQSPESLARKLRALADKRQLEAAREKRATAHALIGAASGYRAIADALDKQPEFPWLASHRDTVREPAAEFEAASDDEPAADVDVASKAA
jgi:hypothetical protein